MNQKVGSPESITPDFTGRQDELRAFGAALEDAKREVTGAHTILLAGEPGIGKTRLAEEMAEMAARAGFLVLWGRWRDGVQRPELWVWGQLLRSLLRAYPPAVLGLGLESALSEVSSLLPELRDEMPGLPPALRDVGGQKRLRLFDAVSRLLVRACAITPLVLVFDNLHLAAEVSLDLLAEVIGDQAALPLMVVATFRDLPVHHQDPLASFLSGIRELRTVHEVPLGPLSHRDTILMARHLLGDIPSSALLEEIWERTKGLPLFVKEAARLLHHDADRGEADMERVWKEQIPEALNVAIRLRVRRMPSDAVRQLQGAAVIGESVTEKELRLAGLDGGESGQDGLEEAVRHGFLSRGDSPGEYHFTHALVHSAVRMQMRRRDRRALCVGLARAVEREHENDLGPWALRLVRWWGEAEAAQARSRVRRYLIMAGEAAGEAGNWEEAILLIERAFDPDREAVETEETARAMFGLGTAYYRSGHQERGIQLLQKSFDGLKRLGQVEAMARIATMPVYLHVGQPGFHDFFEEILPLLPPGSQPEAEVLHFYGIAQILCVGDYSRAEQLLHRALETGVRVGDTVIEARNLAGLGFLDNAHGRYADCVEKGLRVLDLQSRRPDLYAESHGLYVMSSALMALGRGAEAVAYEDRLLEIALQSRDGIQIGSAEQLRARSAVMNGSWEEASRLSDAGLAACPDHLFHLAFRAFMEYTRGDFEAGDVPRGRILALQKLTPLGPWRAHIQAASTAAVRARNSGDSSELRRYVPLLQSIAAHPGVHPFVLQRARLLLAFIASLTDDAGLAHEQYHAIQRLPPLQLVRPYLRERFLGMAAHCLGDHQRAVGHMETALRMARHYGDRPLEAWILCELGETLTHGAEGKTATQARARLVEARELSSRLSMPPLQRRVASALGRLSELLDRGVPPHPHLSERERQVLELVSLGLTNDAVARELCISPNTVGNHIGSLLQKLGATNRTEAVSRARQMRIIG